MLKCSLYQILQALFEHMSYPIGLVGPLMHNISDSLTAASAVNFVWKQKKTPYEYYQIQKAQRTET